MLLIVNLFAYFILIFLVIIWVILSFNLGYAGFKKNEDFWMPFILSVLLSPVAGIFMIWNADPKVIRSCLYCGREEKKTEFCAECQKNNAGLTQEEINNMNTLF
jgi:hypothetical protein